MRDPYYQKRLAQSKKTTKLRNKVRPLSEQIRVTSQMLMATIGILFVVSFTSFLYIRSLQSAKGYTLKQLQTEYEQLSNDQRELESLLNKAQSLTELHSSELIEAMETTGESPIDYVGEVGGVASLEP